MQHIVFNKSGAIPLQTSKHSQSLTIHDNRSKYYSVAHSTAPESEGKGFIQSHTELAPQL